MADLDREHNIARLAADAARDADGWELWYRDDVRYLLAELAAARTANAGLQAHLDSAGDACRTLGREMGRLEVWAGRWKRCAHKVYGRWKAADVTRFRTSAYVAIAYRWGDTNQHQYIVGAGIDRAEMEAAASGEPEDRGGKYGCALLEVHDETVTRVGYWPSLFGEEGPGHNDRIDALEHIGGDVANAIEFGTAHLPDPARPGVLCAQPVEVPAWLRERAEAHLGFADRMAEARAKHGPVPKWRDREAAAEARGAERERAAIVAWLRGRHVDTLATIGGTHTSSIREIIAAAAAGAADGAANAIAANAHNNPGAPVADEVPHG